MFKSDKNCNDFGDLAMTCDNYYLIHFHVAQSKISCFSQVVYSLKFTVLCQVHCEIIIVVGLEVYVLENWQV